MCKRLVGVVRGSVITFLKTPLSLSPSNMSYAYIMLFFKEDHFIALKRAELFGITDFIANCGGLLGLFMGVSLLSIVEIIYFCTIRWIYRLKGKKKPPGVQLFNGSERQSAASVNNCNAVSEYNNGAHQLSTVRRY